MYKLLIKKTLILLFTTLLLSACGNNHPKLTSYKAFDERFTTVIDTQDPLELEKIGDLFYDRQEATGVEANLDFVYLIDVTTAEGSHRWRCTKTGYCQERTEGAAPNREIWFLEQYRELYTLSKLN
ncbi:MAG: hypothetical protein R3E90_09140 [Marinicella sp.]|nr:hypothetical protein [Xanthomonadales bacterium]